MSPKTKSVGTGSPCGCGGSMTSAAPTCKCGGNGCESCSSPGAFIRPRFFAGQLLTEEDLQLLDTYVVSKNRLHNRFLFGDGVVCGLEVTCQPCGDGGVIVHPGYALDCCGNDILVACATTLDINSMVRDLRRRLLGTDCGDPCADDQTMTKEDDETADPARAATPAADSEATDKPKRAARHYCLYVRYCEAVTDPVSPYSTGDACGAQACEPTRVREGVRFELRCREEENRNNDLFTRLCQCLGDLDGVERNSISANYFRAFGRTTDAALMEIKAHPVPAFEQSHLDAMTQAAIRLTEALKALGDTDATGIRAILEGGGQSEVTEAALRTALDATLDTASFIARFYSRDPKEQAQLQKDLGGLTKKLFEAEVALTAAPRKFSANMKLLQALPTLERESAIALLETVGGKLLDRKTLTGDPEVRLLAEGAVFSPRIMAASASSLDALREWVLDRLDKSPYLTDCELRSEVERVILTPPVTQGKVGFSDASAYRTAANRLYDIFVRLLRDCICLALNPSCAPCDDTAVLLACLEVEDCDVIRICNLDRKFVLSPSAVRYWFPQIGLLGEEFEKFCCPEDKAEYVRTSGTFTTAAITTRSLNLSRFAPTALSLLAGSMGRICRADSRQFGRVGKSIFALFRQPVSASGQSVLFRQLATSGPEEAPRATAATAATAAAPPFDLTSAVGRSVMDRIAAFVDSRIDTKLAENKPSAPAGPEPEPEPKKKKGPKHADKDDEQ